MPIDYKNQLVGKHRLDILAEDCVIVELKAIAAIGQIQIAQVISYLKATNVEIGLVVNFGEKHLKWKRLIR